MASSPELQANFGAALVNAIPNKEAIPQINETTSSLCMHYEPSFSPPYPYRSRAGPPVGHPTRCRVGVDHGSGGFRSQGFFGAFDVLVEFHGGDALGAFRKDELLFGQVAGGDIDFGQHVAQFFDDAFDVGVGGLPLLR